MLALLVQATQGEAHLIHANPGDWGIDVLVGDMAGRVTIWQAKYYINGIKETQRRNIRNSFGSALRHAADNEYDVERWILCVPCSLDPATTRWWQRWKAEQEERGPRIELWDENQLRVRLSRPAADHIRRIYYDPYRQPSYESPVASSSPLPRQADRRWRGGNELLAGGASYLLHDDAAEYSAADQSWIWREATADRIEPDLARVWLRQADAVRPSGAPTREALRLQAGLLRSNGGERGLPELVGCVDDPRCTTLITRRPVARTWREAFGPLPSMEAPADRLGPPDRVTGASALDNAADAGAVLHRLHRLGHAHRALDPDGILLADRPRRTVLRDLGLTGLPPRPGEGRPGYRAPEQQRRGGTSPGPATDTYQLAALVYHTMTGHPPSTIASPPLRASVPDLPEELDRLIQQALDPHPDRRPAMAAIVTALRDARRQLSRGAVR